MRAATAFVVIVFATTGARAAPCHWDEIGMPPLREHDGAIHILRQYTCPHDAQGSLRIEVTATAGTNTVTAKELKTEVVPKGKWLRTKKLSERLGWNGFCDAKPGKRARRSIIGHGSDQRVVYDVVVRAKAIGTGDMKAMAWKAKTTLRCRACDYTRGSVALTEGRAHVRTLSKKSRITVSANRAWVECAKPGATFSLRFFADRNGIPARNAIRPIYVVDGLERHFKRKGDKYAIDQPVPLAQICRAAGSGKHKMMWEVFGKGELMRIGGGGRSWIDVRCP